MAFWAKIFGIIVLDTHEVAFAKSAPVCSAYAIKFNLPHTGKSKNRAKILWCGMDIEPSLFCSIELYYFNLFFQKLREICYASSFKIHFKAGHLQILYNAIKIKIKWSGVTKRNRSGTVTRAMTAEMHY